VTHDPTPWELTLMDCWRALRDLPELNAASRGEVARRLQRTGKPVSEITIAEQLCAIHKLEKERTK
jgi:hypothetical protein